MKLHVLLQCSQRLFTKTYIKLELTSYIRNKNLVSEKNYVVLQLAEQLLEQIGFFSERTVWPCLEIAHLTMYVFTYLELSLTGQVILEHKLEAGMEI